MKIKAAVKLTGLTEKTIRFYEDKGLITPDKEEINGRIFRSYSEEDVEYLNLIANLRKLDFSISDIIIMRDNPETIPEMLKGYCSKTSDELSFKTSIIQQLKQIEFEDITKLEDLVEQLKEISKNRPLPVSDIEFEFYKMDGITKAELQGEILKYEGRISTRFKKKIRNTTIFFSLAQIVFIVLTAFLWRATYFLGYVPTFQNHISWRKLIIPLFVLLFCGFIFIFVKAIKFIIKLSEEDKAINALQLCRYSILVLLISFSVGLVISVQSLKSMEELRTEVGRDVAQEWYSLYKMADYVDKYLSSSDAQEEGISLSLYVNQTCYNFAFTGYGDKIHTKMYDLLVWCYDPAFKELVISHNRAKTDKIEQLLKEINSELNKISIEILDKTVSEKADLVRYDLQEATEFRQRINNFVDKYYTQVDDLLK